MKKKAPKHAEPGQTENVVVPEIIVSSARKKNLPRTAFRTGGPNPHAFMPGHVPTNKGSGPRELRLVGHHLREQLSKRAPDTMCAALNLPSHSSWAACMATSLIKRSLRGDHAATELIMRYSEGTKVQLALESNDAPRHIEIVFVESDGDGSPRQIDIESGYYQPPASLPARTIEGDRSDGEHGDQ